MNLKSIFSAKSLSQALPWVTTVSGTIFFIVSVFVDFKNQDVKIFLSGLGKTLLAGGIFAFILKTQQLLGVYKDELTKVIFEPKFLQNRKDLAEFWEKTTLELFKHKFPGINKKITKDVKEIYLPTQSVQYYDNLRMYIDVHVIDKEKELIQVVQTSKFTIIPCDKECFKHEFRNNIHTGGNHDDFYYELKKFRVNDTDQHVSLNIVKHKTHITTEYDVELSGKDGYNIEITAVKKYSLKHDCIIGNVSVFVRNNFTVTFNYKGITVSFIEVGTLNKFKTNSESEGSFVKEYTGVVYPKQGFLAIMKIS